MLSSLSTAYFKPIIVYLIMITTSQPMLSETSIKTQHRNPQNQIIMRFSYEKLLPESDIVRYWTYNYY